jgi:CheY-like chemotaxis protein
MDAFQTIFLHPDALTAYGSSHSARTYSAIADLLVYLSWQLVRESIELHLMKVYNPIQPSLMPDSIVKGVMRILLVEDSVLLRETLKETLLECTDLRIAGEAATQDEAISLLQQMPFDMIPTDIELKQGNGFEVIRYTLNDSFPYPKPLCMILTNHSNALYLDMATDLSVRYFFDKSLDIILAIEAVEAEARKFASHK